jgi:hypothetical protein
MSRIAIVILIYHRHRPIGITYDLYLTEMTPLPCDKLYRLSALAYVCCLYLLENRAR